MPILANWIAGCAITDSLRILHGRRFTTAPLCFKFLVLIYTYSMLSYFQGIVLGALQGISELFPISSLGHSVILPQIFGWNVNEQSPFFLMLLVATHCATALVLLAFFWKDWMRILGGLFRSFKEREIKESDPDAKLAWLLIAGTIPAGILGLLFKDQIQQYFITSRSAAFFLMLNGILLAGAEFLRRRKKRELSDIPQSDTRIAKLSFWQGIKVGTMQILALIPGFSRTGSAIAGGLLSGLSHEDAIRFSFLLATPIIGAAAVLELPQLLLSGNTAAILVSLSGALAAALFAYLSVKFLTSYFAIADRTLAPFAAYCFLAGIAAMILLR
jgi:undecaprenyl-diphosphatase